jgi:molybdopterin converting factor small subunit
MPVVRLRAPLSELTGGTQHEVEGATVGAALRALEARYPVVRGWVLDEQSRLRVHINVFVNGERRDEASPVSPGDVVFVLPAITGG